MKTPLIDLQQQIECLKPEIMAKVEELLDAASFIMGSEVQQLESDFCSLAGAAHAISCNSGTDALLLILEAIGIGEGDEVITSPFTFFATAECISKVGARPVFVDVDVNTLNLDVSKIEAVITPHTKAIIPVHIFGQPVDMEPLMNIARKHDLRIIEDACQAVGASYTLSDGTVRPVGSIGDAAAFSFYPTKNLGAFGDGGMITTNDDHLACIIKGLRTHGGGMNGKLAYEQLSGEQVELQVSADATMNATVYDPTKYYNFLIGMNSRLDAMQAAILRVKLPHLREWNDKRRELARRYDQKLAAAGLLGGKRLVPQKEFAAAQSVYHLYIVRCEEREELCAYLAQCGVATGVYYPVPLHLQKVYQMGKHNLGYKSGDLPVSEWLSKRTMALPLFPELTEDQQDYIVDTIAQFYAVQG